MIEGEKAEGVAGEAERIEEEVEAGELGKAKVESEAVEETFGLPAQINELKQKLLRMGIEWAYAAFRSCAAMWQDEMRSNLVRAYMTADDTLSKEDAIEMASSVVTAWWPGTWTDPQQKFYDLAFEAFNRTSEAKETDDAGETQEVPADAGSDAPADLATSR